VATRAPFSLHLEGVVTTPTTGYYCPEPAAETHMKRLLSLISGIGLAALAVAPTFAAEPAYLDDRSTAASLVKSYYNAVNRHEYARAYTYFGPNGGPKPYEDFAQGYADTEYVSVLTGQAQGDGAAGSIYYTIPVAIDALSDDGGHQQFAGCYVTRLIEPGNQDPPVVPMYIDEARLHVAHGRLASILPDCPLQ
jgi:hypothetical protein